MYSFQAVVRKCANNTINQFERLGYVGNAMANLNTTGYKAERFEQLLDVDGYLKGAVRTDYSQGSLRITKSPYDVALDGPGFIPVVSPSGEVAYTRDGSFKQGKDGYLLTNDDWMVGDGIKLPTNCHKFTVKPNGEVMVYDEAGSAVCRKVGTIPVVQFDCPEGLVQAGMNKMKPTEESGEPKLVKNHEMLCQHQIETSNTSVYGGVNEMLRLNASMIASMRMIKVVDDMYNKAINIREG
jgi:flagellar basal-body rod protein FlgG